MTSQRSATVAPTYAPQAYGPYINPNVSAYRASEARYGLAPQLPTRTTLPEPFPSTNVPSGQGIYQPNGATGEPTMEDLMSLLGMAGLGGTDNSLGYAQLALQREQMAQDAAQFAQSLEQARQIEAARQAQAQREAALAVGQFMAQQQSQNWQAGMPFVLPAGTSYAPGFEPGGPASRLAQMAHAAYTAPQLAVSNGPSRQDMERWLESALRKFGPQ